MLKNVINCYSHIKKDLILLIMIKYNCHIFHINLCSKAPVITSIEVMNLFRDWDLLKYYSDEYPLYIFDIYTFLNVS